MILQDIFFQAERVVYDAFMSPEFVDRLVSFLSLEENKGKDKYDTRRFSMFKVRRNSAYNLREWFKKKKFMIENIFH